MLSTTLVAPAKIIVETPQSENSEEQDEVSVTVTILRTGEIYLNNKNYSLIIII